MVAVHCYRAGSVLLPTGELTATTVGVYCYQMPSDSYLPAVHKKRKARRRSSFFLSVGYVCLLRNNQVVVLLAALNQQVLVVQQVGNGDYLVEGSQLFLVQRNAATLYQLAHLAL